MDGWITIGTKLDSKDLERGLRQAESDMKKFAREEERLLEKKGKISLDLSEYEKQKKLLQENYDERLKFANTEEQVKMVLGEEEIALKSLNNEYQKTFQEQSLINKQLEKNSEKQNITTAKIKEMNKELHKAQGFQGLNSTLSEMKNNLESSVKKVGRLIIGVFGVASAYRMVTSAMSVLQQYDEKLSVDIEYIRYALAMTLKPVVENIVKLMYTLLTYVNYLSKAWFGVNIFANASKNAFVEAEESSKKTSKSTGKTAKNLKEMRKELAGFDEMNILGNTASDAIGKGAGAGDIGKIVAPSWDLASLKDIKVPSWLEWLSKNGKTIAIIIASIGAGLLAWKLGGLVANMAGITTGLTAFKGGLALAAAGVVLMGVEIANMILNWDKMSKQEKILSASLAVLGGAFIALGVSIGLGFSAATLEIGAWVAVVVGLMTYLTTWLVKEAQLNKQMLTNRDTAKDLKQAEEDLNNARKEYANAVDNLKEKENALNEAQKQTGISGKELYDLVQEGKLKYEWMNEEQQKVYKAYLNLTEAQKEAKNAQAEELAARVQEIRAKADDTAKTQLLSKEYDKYKNTVVDAYHQGGYSAEDARDRIEQAMADMDESTRKTFKKGLPDSITTGLNPDKYTTTLNKFKKGFLDTFDSLKKGWDGVVEGFSVAFNISKTKTSKNAKGAIYLPPKLAVGGIINQPGRGIPIGSAIAGERGAEGVIPLTDSQQMALLGEAIGKYININATVPIYVGNRQIAREIKKINNESNFVYNR